jgi:hypothetical protein
MYMRLCMIVHLLHILVKTDGGRVISLYSVGTWFKCSSDLCSCFHCLLNPTLSIILITILLIYVSRNIVREKRKMEKIYHTKLDFYMTRDSVVVSGHCRNGKGSCPGRDKIFLSAMISK